MVSLDYRLWDTSQSCKIIIIPHLCRDDDDALLLRLAPGLPELRELEFEELWAQEEAGRRCGGDTCRHS